MSAFDLWTHSFCLACDKQVQVDGAAYCSESCRLSDYEKTSASGSQPTSPGFPPTRSSSTSATFPAKSGSTKFYLSPAYDFSDAQPYGTTPPPQKSFFAPRQAEVDNTLSNRHLTPSSSHSSLSSMHSSCSNTENTDNLSATARKELQAYAVSFEYVRLQRRRSY